MRRGLQIGCVVDETRLEFSRGDFLVRGVVGADQRSGAIAVPGWPELAFWTASIASPRITLMALVSSSFAMRALPRSPLWISQPAYRRSFGRLPSWLPAVAGVTHSPQGVFRR